MVKVEVLMSTYNGEKYIREQLDSILNQRNIDIYILIRDDGSTDRTLDIIEEYKKRHKDKIRIFAGENKGVKHSFLELVNLSDETMDYYAFSDQDDIWLDNKVSRATEVLKKYKSNIPLIYGSNVNVKSAESITTVDDSVKMYSFGNFLVKNYFPGCTLVFNHCLRSVIKEKKFWKMEAFPLHDHWLCLICTGCGGLVVKDSQAHIYYRQHDANVVGNNRSLLTKVIENGVFSNEQRRYKIAVQVYDVYYDMLNSEAKQQINTILRYKENIRNRMALAADRKIKPESLIEKIALVITILIGRF